MTDAHSPTDEPSVPSPGMWPPLPEPTDDAAELARVARVISDGPFNATWESLARYEPPRWYRDAKFGIFIHWGVYSVPGFGGEWYARHMYRAGSREFHHHRQNWGNHREFGYKDFIPMFTGSQFDPDDWAALFHAAGAQFVMPVAEHHDGFAMYDTARSRWSAANMGPQRDVCGELAEAVRRRWMVFAASTHRAEHWFFMNGGARFDSDVRDPEFADFYGPAQREECQPNDQFLQDWFLRTIEIIDRYQPQVLWFDWWIEQPAFRPWLARLAAYYYNSAAARDQEVVINYKWDAFVSGTAVHDIERGTKASIQPEIWQNDTSVARDAWCWVEGHQYKSLSELIAELVDVVAKNGVLLLNIGPKPDGTIPERERELLMGIGEWLAVNGEAIYGTRPWLVAGEGPTRVAEGSFTDGHGVEYSPADIRFTTREHVTGHYVYATVLVRPDDGVVHIRSFGRSAGLLTTPIRELSVLGHDGPVDWKQGTDTLEVRLPETREDSIGVAIKLWMKQPVTPERRDFFH